MDKNEIFEFQNYRAFLKNYVRKLPRSRGQLKAWAKFLNVHTTLISQVMMGKRDFTEEQAWEICHFIGLNKLEREYFLELVRIERAGSSNLKQHLIENLELIKSKSQNFAEKIIIDKKLSDQQSAIFYSSWIYSAVRLCCSLNDGATIDDISLKINIDRQKVIQVIEFLRECNLVKLNGSKFVMGPQYTHLRKESPYVVRHHANWRIKAIQRSDQIDETELMYTSPFSISEKDFEVLRKYMQNVIQDFINVVKKSEAETLACFNLDLIKM